MRAIDQRLGQSKDGHFYERKVTLLSREDQIETDFDQQVGGTHVLPCVCTTVSFLCDLQSRAPVKPVTFTVALNTSFFSCAK